MLLDIIGTNLRRLISMAIHARSQLDLVTAINVLATITDKNKDEAGVKSIIKTLMCGLSFFVSGRSV